MGVQKETITEGDGKTFPQKGNRLKVHYKGTLASNGTQFDSSYDRHKPFTFVLGKGDVIPGWEAVSQMSLGEKAKLNMPSDVCYGSEGCEGVIPPNADLEFEVELLDIKDLGGNNNSTAVEEEKPTAEAEEPSQSMSSRFTSFFKPVERPKPLTPDSTLDQDLQNSADDANLTLYFVNMVVVKATNLPNTDYAVLMDKTDPYAVVTIGQISDRTPTINDVLNPVWNERMSFFVPQKPATMQIRVMDTNSTLQDDHVGNAEFEFGSFFEIGGFFEGELPLKSPKGADAGSIHINLKCRTLKPVETEIKLGYAQKQLECLGLQQDATVAALDESEELRKQVVGELGTKEQEVLKKAKELEEAVTKHDKELSVKDQELLDRAQEIERKIQEKEEAEVARRQAELKEKEAALKLTEAEKEILAQADLLEAKERDNADALTAKEKEILAVADKLEEKEKLGKAVQERLEQVEALKTEVENELTSKDKIIQQQAKDLERLQASGEELTKKEQEIVQQAKLLDEKDAAAKEAQKKQDAVYKELDEMRKENEALQQRAEQAEAACGCSVM